jgi:DNA polymerase III sliding clamp (beta) subunit (PCNA family)
MQDGTPNGATLRSLGLIVRIPDGASFPPFESIIPNQEEATAKVSIVASSAIAATKEATKEAALAEALQGGRVDGTRILTLAAGARGVMVASSNQEPRRVDSSYGTGGEAAAVNAEYLLEALEGMRDTASLYLTGEQRPLVLQDYDRTAIVMPIRSKEDGLTEKMQQLRALVGQAHAVAATA